MDWFMTIILFGLIALALFLCSSLSIREKRYKAGLLFAVLELLSGIVSSAAWAWALKVSGKIYWFLLGILGYTPIGVIFWCMDGVGIICLALCIRGLLKNRRTELPA